MYDRTKLQNKLNESLIGLYMCRLSCLQEQISLWRAGDDCIISLGSSLGEGESLKKPQWGRIVSEKLDFSAREIIRDGRDADWDNAQPWVTQMKSVVQEGFWQDSGDTTSCGFVCGTEAALHMVRGSHTSRTQLQCVKLHTMRWPGFWGSGAREGAVFLAYYNLMTQSRNRRK